MGAIDTSQVARGTGIEVDKENLGSGTVRYVPQRVILLAMGETGISHTTTKFEATGGPKQVGETAGYKSQAYAMMKELYPDNGGGLGTIPTDVLLLAEAGGSTQATGDITASASAVSKATTFFAKIGGKKCQNFVIPKTTTVAATDLTDFHERLRQSIDNTLGIPATVLHEYGTVTDTPGGSNAGDGAVTVTVASGGLPKAGTWVATCTAVAMDLGTFTIVDPDGFTVGTITVDTAADLAGLNWDIADGAADWELGDVHTIEVPSSKLNVSPSWKGSSGNDLTLEIVGDTSTGVTWSYTQPTGGAGNPSIAAALAQIKSSWGTKVINPFEISDTTTLDALQDWIGNPEDETGRWAPDVRKPCVAVGGNNKATVDDASAYSYARSTDNGNVTVNVPASPALPCLIAAAAVAQMATRANDQPGHDFGRMKLSSIEAGAESTEWTTAQRDAAIKRGVATTEIRDNVVVLSDMVTMYRPTGEDPPAYRHVCDIVKLEQVIYNFDLKFDGEEWDGKLLIAAGQATTREDARTTDMALTDARAIIDNLALAAIIADPGFSKKALTATIGGPKRLNVVAPFKVAGNTNQRAISLKWDFFRG